MAALLCNRDFDIAVFEKPMLIAILNHC